jgi:hypothetical protein
MGPVGDYAVPHIQNRGQLEGPGCWRSRGVLALKGSSAGSSAHLQSWKGNQNLTEVLIRGLWRSCGKGD